MASGWTIKAGRLLAVWAIGGTLAFGQTAETTAPEPRDQAPAPAPSQAQAAEGAPSPTVDPAKMEKLLALWERQSTLLKTLDAKVFRTDVIPAWDEIEYYEGRAIFKSPNLAFIDFRKIKQDDDRKPVKDPKTNAWVSVPEERILCTGDEVWQYKSDTRQIFIYPLEEGQAEKAIEEGPLPFLFNMKAESAKKRYDMTLMSEDEKAYGISIKPRLDVDKESFSQAFVQLDRKYLLPIRIVLVSPDGKSKKDFQLGPIEPNKPVDDSNFKGKTVANWKVIRNPSAEDIAGEAPAASAAAPATRGERPVNQAASRPAQAAPKR